MRETKIDTQPLRNAKDIMLIQRMELERILYEAENIQRQLGVYSSMDSVRYHLKGFQKRLERESNQMEQLMMALASIINKVTGNERSIAEYARRPLGRKKKPQKPEWIELTASLTRSPIMERRRSE